MPGSPEAVAADREKDRLRKERQRQRDAAAVQPAALPAATATGAGAVAAPGPAAPPPGGSPAGAGLSDGALVLWDCGTLAPLFEELVPAAEASAVQSHTVKAAKAGLPVELIKDIERDAAWSPVTRKAVTVSTPRVLAKYLNKLGVSAEYSDEAMLATALAYIAASHLKISARLDKLIAMNGKPAPAPAAKPEGGKP